MLKTAIVITVKNEERLIKQNILYHLGIGIDYAFVYFDGSTDRGKEIIQTIDGVYSQDSVEQKKYSHLSYLEKFWKNAQEHHTARQCLNTYDAIQKSKKLGVNWLISLDADELFLTNSKGQQSLSDFFSHENTNNYDVIRLKTLEVVNRRINYHNVMSEETLFKSKKNFKSKFDQLYRNVYNPYTNKSLKVSYWMGHTMGKTAIRVNDEIIPHNVHRFKLRNINDSIKVKNSGYILHYHMYDFNDFIKKYENFKNHPSTFLSGNKIETLKSLWIKLVNDPKYDKGFLKEYFIKNILFKTGDIDRLSKTRVFNVLKRKENATIEITKPSEILQ